MPPIICLQLKLFSDATVNPTVLQPYFSAPDSLTLSCTHTSSALNPTFQWWIDSAALDANPTLQHLTSGLILSPETTSQLEIPSAEGLDSGLYYCEVTWPDVGTKRSGSYLLGVREVVHIPALFSSANNLAVVVTCTAYGDTVSGVTWAGNSGSIATSSYTTPGYVDYKFQSVLTHTASQADDLLRCSFTYVNGNSQLSDTIAINYIAGSRKMYRICGYQYWGFGS